MLAWSHREWKSWYDIKVQLVRFFTQSEYAHVAIAWVIGERVFVLEAVMPLVRIFPLSKLGDFYWLPMGCAWSPKTEELALSAIGDQYSQWDAIKAFFSSPAADHTWECAEYVMQVLKNEDIELGTSAVPSDVVRAALMRGAQMAYVQAKP